jgi:hypothetical protein
MVKDALWDAFNDYHMITTADNIAKQWKLTREELDEFALKSQQKACAAIESGAFKDEIVPVEVKKKKETVIFDESNPRRSDDLAAVNRLQDAQGDIVFLSRADQLGTIYNMEEDEDGEVIRWNHFYVKLPARFVFSGGNDTRQAEISQYRDKRNVFKRALDELTIDAVETVLELINQGSLYRGDEYKHILEEFLKCKRQYAALSPEKQELYAWEKSVTLPDPVAKVRNTAIGTLLIDVTSEMDLDQAVSRYEAVVAPQNYKRSKPVFTQQMVEDAQRTITELGYLDSLERRYANADDITINNVLFSNRDTAKRLQGAGDIFSMMAREASQQPRQFSKTEEIPIEEFIEHVLPTATEIEAYVEGKHIPNMMSLIAPVHKDSKTMFKWHNNFSWAYTGNVTDSLLKQNVKNAGGRVDGVLRFSIQWNDLEASLND